MHDPKTLLYEKSQPPVEEKMTAEKARELRLLVQKARRTMRVVLKHPVPGDAAVWMSQALERLKRAEEALKRVEGGASGGT
jgi:hypothetical protein